ncbi:MAG: glutamine synthetase [Prevotella shahii]|jgi:glutamine synthetase, beta-grasp domain protein|uniref:Glutamine synthetase n=1 Tax=Hoylesella shahii DSM 15611 = JCM 12083 TaxID=1122991 RepID=A0A318I0J0_9BACT|nr:glutamine synthetase family protein [Hoylesella shahii]MBF1575346.1 glutamine synthetase [Hoylesella shahii]MBF1590219.1 glutamine synthetase [Hoylesella shahii]PXX24092.1 glutamine synthetase [Hoylesella shahii DSM 15611 = JCM 12083]
MANNELLMNANEVVAFLQKPSSEFTKEDIVRFIQENEIKMVNFMYPGGDGKLKTLNFIINNLAYLDTILTCGERVDGSSLFSFIQAGSSDLYVLPRFSSAFVDPFAEIPTLCMLASYFDKDGNPLESSPEYTLAKAAKAFRDVTGMEFHAMGELEYYVITPDEEVFPAVDQRGYHESMPYAKTNDFRTLCMSYIAKAGGQIKYGHSEVGNFSQDGLIYEQNEIEFLPVPVEKAADELMIAKWIIRNLAYQMGMNVTFAPKITTGKAGSGMHVHMRLMKDGKSVMVENGKLSNTARTAIAGLMQLADSITAFGNKNPMAYFRLVPHQEAPTNVCWGDRNRSVLVRVPLGWAAGVDMMHKANPQQPAETPDTSMKQTFEMRSPDGSADVYQLLAGLCVGCRYGFELPNALEIAEQTYVDVNIHDAANADKLNRLGQLPDSCVASADCLERQRKVYEAYGVFSTAMIDGIIKQLRDFNDSNLRKEVENRPEELKELVERYFHCG